MERWGSKTSLLLLQLIAVAWAVEMSVVCLDIQGMGHGTRALTICRTSPKRIDKYAQACTRGRHGEGT